MMAKYNNGDKFLLEIDSVMTTNGGSNLYRIKGFRSLVFDDYGLDRLEKVLAVGKLDLKKDDGIEVGDEVESTAGVRAVVTNKHDNILHLVFSDGSTMEHDNADGRFHKIGERTDVIDALKVMKYKGQTHRAGSCSKCKYFFNRASEAPCVWCANCDSSSDWYYWEKE